MIFGVVMVLFCTLCHHHRRRHHHIIVAVVVITVVLMIIIGAIKSSQRLRRTSRASVHRSENEHSQSLFLCQVHCTITTAAVAIVIIIIIPFIILIVINSDGLAGYGDYRRTLPGRISVLPCTQYCINIFLCETTVTRVCVVRNEITSANKALMNT